MDSRQRKAPARRSHPRSTTTSRDDSLFELHERVIAGDEAALNQATERLLHLLQRALRGAFPHTPVDWITDAAEDAILDYVRRPDRFDAKRRVWLERFLLSPAIRNLINRAEHERLLKRREETYVAQMMLDNRLICSPGLEGHGDFRALLLAAAANDGERQALMLLLDGVCDPATLARALGTTECPTAEQRREIKRFRDRLIKRVRRASR